MERIYSRYAKCIITVWTNKAKWVSEFWSKWMIPSEDETVFTFWVSPPIRFILILLSVQINYF